MSLTRREFLKMLAAAGAAGMLPNSRQALASTVHDMYDLLDFGNNVTLLHITDTHAQLLPLLYREPDTNIGVAKMAGRPPHLVGDAFLKHFNITPGTALAHAFTYIDFAHAAKIYGKVGGYAHLATLIKRLKAQRPGAILLDGGDAWQGSATALWTKGADMIRASKLLGVDVMTGHWEFTYGEQRIQDAIKHELPPIEFVAQNVKTSSSGDPVFKPYVIKEVNKIPIAIIGQAFPYVPIAHPRSFVKDWTFGIQEEHLQKMIDEVTKKGAQVIVLLSHNGMDIDLKLASRISGIDVILGGHTHDAVPAAMEVRNRGGYTLVTNAGSNGKYVGVVDLNVKGGILKGWQYRLMPVFSNLLAPDKTMDTLIAKVRAPYEKKLAEKLAVTDELLYRRGNFNGTFDQLIVDAMMDVKGADIGFSPGFRWGTTLLPHETITMEHLMDQTAITYPYSTLTEMDGKTIKSVMEDVCDSLFNPDPYLKQGGDMVRVGGMQYTCDPTQTIGKRISNMTLKGKPIEADKKYKVAGWAPIAPGATGEPIWDVVAEYLRHKKVIRDVKLNRPKIIGLDSNPGLPNPAPGASSSAESHKKKAAPRHHHRSTHHKKKR